MPPEAHQPLLTDSLRRELAATGISDLTLVAPLCQGTSNQNFLAVAGKDSWVLRINNPLTHKLCPRASEVACWRAAQAVGLAPELRFVSEDYRYYLSRYIDTDPLWHRHYAHNPRTVPLLLELLAGLQQLPLPAHQVMPQQQWDFYQAELSQRRPQLTGPLLVACDELLGHADALQPVLARMNASAQKRFCHRDLNPHNLLLSNGKLLCIDFEYACTSDPRMELAALLASHDLSATQINRLINSYLAGDAEAKAQGLRDASFLYWLFTACWALLMCHDGKGALSWLHDALHRIQDWEDGEINRVLRRVD